MQRLLILSVGIFKYAANRVYKRTLQPTAIPFHSPAPKYSYRKLIHLPPVDFLCSRLDMLILQRNPNEWRLPALVLKQSLGTASIFQAPLLFMLSKEGRNSKVTR